MPERIIYLSGIAGSPERSPALRHLESLGHEIVEPDVPGFNGASGFVAPDSYLDWLTTFWDAIDATGATPCAVIGASVGAMIAADLAAMRPEAVTKLALLAPFGIVDAADPGFDLYGIPSAERMPHLFAKGVPDAFANRFAERGDEEAPVARYLCDIAAASLVWPLGDRGLAKRLHRMPSDRLVLWGDQDEVNPVSRAALWGGAQVIAGAGHLMEWDTPEAVGDALAQFFA